MTALVGSLLPYIIAGVAAFLALAGFGVKKKREGMALQKAKEAQARADNLAKLKKATDAAAAVRPGDGGELSDPNNRDNWSN